MTVRPPVSLYVHFPWCIRKCPYCDFNSHTLRTELDESSYVNALISDLEQDLEQFGNPGRPVSVFLGGGTPSLFSARAMEHLLQGIDQTIGLRPDTEITLEANPGSLEHDQFSRYKAAGITRVSIGVQSFDNHQLKRLGRIHDGQTAANAIENACRAGFDNINLDLMFGLPGQSTDQALSDCKRAMQFSPCHLSFYQLTIEPNTYFYRFPPENLPDNDQQWAMQCAIQGLLQENGYSQYEVSAYCTPDKECRHNLNYWQFGDYLGIGAGAHGKITSATGIQRYWKEKHPTTYLEKVKSAGRLGGTSTVDPDAVLFEFLLNGLRLKNGVSRATLTAHAGLQPDTVVQALKPLVDEQLLEVDELSVRCSENGYRFIDEILQRLLPEASAQSG